MVAGIACHLEVGHNLGVDRSLEEVRSCPGVVHNCLGVARSWFNCQFRARIKPATAGLAMVNNRSSSPSR